jgi:signal transduction histidine kinase
VHPSVKENELVVEALLEDVSVRTHGTDLIQILLNLAVNAFQCSPEKHLVEISARYLRTPLDLDQFADGPGDRLVNRDGFKNTAPLLALAVRDTGPGIPPEILPKIFAPYFTTKPPPEGTGLGLNVVLRLIKEARAALHVHTKIGEGTTMTIYLPTT